MFDHLYYLAQEPPVEGRKGEVGTPCKTSFVSALQQTVTVMHFQFMSASKCQRSAKDTQGGYLLQTTDELVLTEVGSSLL